MSRYPVSNFVLSRAEHYQQVAEDAEPENMPKFGRYWRLSDRLYRLHYWLGLPWRCRLLGHSEPLNRRSYDVNIGVCDKSWLECSRCQHWFGWAEDDPFDRGKKVSA